MPCSGSTLISFKETYLTIKKFIVFSVIIHIGIFIGMYIVPEGAKNKPKEFITRLISPEELSKPAIKPSLPLPPALKKNVPSRIPPKAPALPASPRFRPSPDKPLVPGMGKETGKQLPKGVYPGPGESEKPGEGPDARARELDGSRKSGVPQNGTLNDKPGYLDRAKLFDQGVIGDSARKEEAGSQKKKKDSITFDTSDYKYAGYMRKLKEKIESIWVYPPEAQAKGWYGDLKIRFTIKKDGKLGAVELERTSGYPVLDKAAIKALKDCEPYWPVPEEWGMDSYTILGHFVYTIYGYQLR